MPDDQRGYTRKIPQDVSRPDRIMFGATARQCLILGGTAAGLWVVWICVRSFVPPLLFAAPAGLLLLLLGIAVSAERDGTTADRLLAAALRQTLAPRRRVMAPEGIGQPPSFLNEALRGQDRSSPGPLDLPVESVRDDGVVNLGSDGAAALASCSTVNFALRTPAEQELLIGGFARWLNSLTGPVQITSRTTPADLSTQVNTLRAAAQDLSHPRLEAAASAHADFLAEIDDSGAVLHRGLLVTAREADTQHAPRAVRRITDAAALLAACEVEATPLNPGEANTALAIALDPDRR